MTDHKESRANKPASLGLVEDLPEQLTPEEVWEERITPQVPASAVVAKGRSKVQDELQWANTPSVGKALLDPRRIPCLRESLMIGIVGGAFSMGAFTIWKGNIQSSILKKLIY
jgi:hypothetical protein